MKTTKNRQSAAKPLLEEGSTTIPSGSTANEISGKRQIYLKNIRHVIYKITCLSNGKFYIGSATFYASRMDKHRWGLRRNKHSNKHLQNVWNKYKEINFKFEIIEYCNELNLLEREQYWMDLTKCYDRNIGFNISKLASSRKGDKMPESAKIAIGNFWRGKSKSKEHVLKYIETQTALSGKPVVQYNNKMEFIAEYRSISEASRASGMCIATISRQCSHLKGQIKPRKYIFRYKDIV
jgi:hypothetical protein